MLQERLDRGSNGIIAEEPLNYVECRGLSRFSCAVNEHEDLLGDLAGDRISDELLKIGNQIEIVLETDRQMIEPHRAGGGSVVSNVREF